MSSILGNYPKKFMREVPPFAFTKMLGGIDSMEIWNKLECYFGFEEIINQHLSIIDYSATIKEILCTYILIDRSKVNLATDDYISRLLPKTKSLEIGLNLDFRKFHAVSETEAKRMMIDKFLWGIENLLAKRKDFDHKRFYADCEHVLLSDKAVNEPVLCMA